MNGLTSRWTWRPIMARAGGAGGGPADLVQRVLSARGYAEGDGAQRFLEPKLTHLHDPSLIPDLDRAASRILDAARGGEPIVIYGDYDVDGITATAILYHTLLAIRPDARVQTYVPHRIDEGYGLNAGALEELAAGGAKVIVSVDCGITAVEPARAAARAGVDLIITDHHHPPARIDDLPPAYAVVHPRRPDSGYPFDGLSGAGVAYKLAWRLATLHAGGRVSAGLREMLVDLLAFAALGTIADIVPLLGENRVLAKFGLVRARHSRFVGLGALVQASGLGDEKIGEMEVGFRLGPRLNAAGRMGHAREAVELLTTADQARAEEIAVRLSAQNESRRAVERDILEQASGLAEASGMTGPDRRAIVLAHPEWHAGVIGIVCSRLVQRYHRPTILMQVRDGSCHGSGRSIDGFDLHAGLTHCAPLLDRFGGHTMAAGLHLNEAKLGAFAEAFTGFANSAIAEELLRPGLTIDCEARADELNVRAAQQLEELAPFGAGNPGVKLLVRDVSVYAQPKLMGGAGKHLSVQLRADEKTVFRAVAWNWGQRIEHFAPGRRIDAVLTPKVSTWSGRAMFEAELRDVRFAEG